MPTVATALGNSCATVLSHRTSPSSPSSSSSSAPAASGRRTAFLKTVATSRRASATRARTRARTNAFGAAPVVMATAAAGAGPPTYLLLTLDYVEDILERRGPHREAHIAGAKAQEEAGKCVLAGALQNPTDKVREGTNRLEPLNPNNTA